VKAKSRVGFEPVIALFKKFKALSSLDHAAFVIGCFVIMYLLRNLSRKEDKQKVVRRHYDTYFPSNASVCRYMLRITYLLTYSPTYLLTYLLTTWCRILFEKLIVTQLIYKYPAFFMEPERSSPCSQKPVIGPHPEPAESSSLRRSLSP
jgi:hypothetical protein